MPQEDPHAVDPHGIATEAMGEPVPIAVIPYWWLVLGGVAVLLLVATAAVAYFSGMRRMLIKDTTLMADMVYAFEAGVDASATPESSALRRPVAEGLMERPKDRGAVLNYRIDRVTSGPFGLPVLVRVEVQRQGGAGFELLIRHSTGGFDDISFEAR